jgi:hypothetical protein
MRKNKRGSSYWRRDDKIRKASLIEFKKRLQRGGINDATEVAEIFAQGPDPVPRGCRKGDQTAS